MKKLSTLLVVAVFLSLLFSAKANAHGEGKSFEATVGEYLIDVGYNAEAIAAGEPVRFDFNAVKQIDSADADFSNVWVRIARGNETIFAGPIYRSSFGLTGFTYTFPKSGAYELAVQFKKDDEKVVESAFPITVVESDRAGDTGANSKVAIGAAVGAIVGFIASSIFRKKT